MNTLDSFLNLSRYWKPNTENQSLMFGSLSPLTYRRLFKIACSKNWIENFVRDVFRIGPRVLGFWQDKTDGYLPF